MRIALIFTVEVDLRLVGPRNGIGVEALHHYFFLEVGCSSHERSGLTLDDGKLVDFLQFKDSTEGPVDEFLIETFGVESGWASVRGLCDSLSEERLL